MRLSHALGRFGAASEDLLADTGRMARLALAAGRRGVLAPLLGRERFRGRAILQQIERAGLESLPLVSLIALLVGMILALQSAFQLRELGAVHLVADLVAVSVVRELAPLLTAILVAGRVGSSVSAELGTMKVSQEIDALRVMGLDPVAYLVAPRILGLMVAVPCLTLFADGIGILGGCAIGRGVLGLGAEGYLRASLAALTLDDFLGGVLKALNFGFLIGLVGCHQGLETRGGADAVGRSTTTAVVRSIVLIIAADLFVTAWLYLRG